MDPYEGKSRELWKLGFGVTRVVKLREDFFLKVRFDKILGEV
jgi:hypothetical protein